MRIQAIHFDYVFNNSVLLLYEVAEMGEREHEKNRQRGQRVEELKKREQGDTN